MLQEKHLNRINKITVLTEILPYGQGDNTGVHLIIEWDLIPTTDEHKYFLN